MKLEFNEEGMRQLYQEIAEKIERVDSALRSKHRDGDLATVSLAAKIQFERIGVTLSQEKLDEYAQAVADGAPFKFELT